MPSQTFEIASGLENWRDLGLVTRLELTQEGHSRSIIEQAIREGRFTRVGPGLLSTGLGSSSELRWLQALGALVVRTQPDGLVAGAAAAALYGLDGFDHRTSPAVEIPASQRLARTAAGHVRRTRHPQTPEWIGCFPVASVASVLAGLGEGLAPLRRWRGDRTPIDREDLVELALECALRRGLLSLDHVASAAWTTNACRGCQVLRTVLARRPDGAPPTESYLETRFVQMLRRAGLAAPERQVEIRDATGGLIGRVDFRRDNILIECDGREYHDRSESFVKDRDRWTRLQAEGYSLIVVTADHVERRPEWTCELLERTHQLRRTA